MKIDTKVPGGLCVDKTQKVHFLTNGDFLQLIKGDKVYIRPDREVDGCGNEAACSCYTGL